MLLKRTNFRHQCLATHDTSQHFHKDDGINAVGLSIVVAVISWLLTLLQMDV